MIVPTVSPVLLVLAAMGLAALSGVPGLFGLPQRLSTLLLCAAGVAGLSGAAWALLSGAVHFLVLPWALPGAEFAVGIDGISALFLLPIFLVLPLGSIYGLSYWRQSEHPDNGPRLRLFYGVLCAAMALLVMARDAVVFLLGWEVMALSAFFLVTTEDEHKAVRDSGWLYLLATHFGTLCLFALFALWHSATGTFALVPLAAAQGLSSATTAGILLLALVGFGLKAGLMPLHVWLPSAHANAPSHVSAAMSGVLIKMGIYGLVRTCSLLPRLPASFGALLLVLGVISGVLGVVCAIAQHDIKRLLAYHSIENIGIIVMGLGLAALGRSLGRADWVVLGLGGALLHVLNHALFKSLLFLSAGSVIHATHTREIDLLGGLYRAMPRTALCFLGGAVAICGLPPLNGFVSELFIYLGLFRAAVGSSGLSWAAAVFAVPALGLIGALAAACFVKVFGAVFLGAARSRQTAHAHEAAASMTAPMAVLLLLCLLIGFVPAAVGPLLSRAVPAFAPEFSDLAAPPLAALAPLWWISLLGAGLLLALVLLGLWLRSLVRRAPLPAGLLTWDCGYAAPAPSMQYTASSFAQMLVDLFAWALWPTIHTPGHRQLFPREEHFHSHVPDTVLQGTIEPAFDAIAALLSRLRFLQQGSVHAYLLYIVVTLIALLLWINLDGILRAVM